MLWELICMVHVTVCSYHAVYMFQSESTLYSCLNVKEFLAWSRHGIWSLSDCNWPQTHNHLVCKWTLHHLAKLAKWLSCVVSTYLYGAFNCTFLSCHVCISEWIHRQNGQTHSNNLPANCRRIVWVRLTILRYWCLKD